MRRRIINIHYRRYIGFLIFAIVIWIRFISDRRTIVSIPTTNVRKVDFRESELANLYESVNSTFDSELAKLPWSEDVDTAPPFFSSLFSSDPNYPFQIPFGWKWEIPFKDLYPIAGKSTIERSRKYFMECESSAHLDKRWGCPLGSQKTSLQNRKEAVRKSPLPSTNEEHLKILRLLFAAWALFADERQLPYNIAHGTLLGWTFGQKQMPWDTDIDVQIPGSYAGELVKWTNQTFFNRYFFDLNPNHVDRSTTEGKNVIDGRFVDTQTGFFIDITLLYIASSTKKSNSTLRCKSPHFYQYTQIYPLVRTSFEGIPTWRPQNVASVLNQEYGAQGQSNSFVYYPTAYRFDQFLHEWMPILTCAELHATYIQPSIDGTLNSPPERIRNVIVAVGKILKAIKRSERKLEYYCDSKFEDDPKKCAVLFKDTKSAFVPVRSIEGVWNEFEQPFKNDLFLERS